MGAVFLTKAFPDCEPKELEDRFQRYCSEQAHSRGHGGYTGTFAEKVGEDLVIEGKRFGSDADAKRWIDERADKWGPALAVRVVPPDEAPHWLVGALCSE